MERRIGVLLSAFLVCASAAFGQPERHRAVRSGQSSSAELIETALENGKITAEQALTYEVFAAFADCRVPAEFHGDDSSVEDTLILSELAAKFDSLSSATQTTLAPFLLEPYAPGGWMQQRQVACGAAKVIQPNEIITSSLLAVDGKVLITYRVDVSGEAARAQLVKTELENTIYPKLTGLMGEPLPRADGTRWHLSLISFGQPVSKDDGPGVTGFVEEHACKHAAAFSEVYSRHAMLLSIVAHELMHAIQFGYDVAAACMNPTYHWLAEATATWAQDFVYPNPPPPPVGDGEHVQTVHFMDTTDLPLDCLSKTHCPGHEYGAYLLPFYIHRRYGDERFVRRIWDAAKTNSSTASVDTALGPYGGFDKEWPEFVRYNWNREPYDEYQRWDHLTEESQRAFADGAVVFLGGGMDRAYEMDTSLQGLIKGPMTLQSLSAQYFHYKFDDPTARSVAFLNGINFKLGIREWSVVPDFGLLYMFDSASKPRDGLKIQALLKINGAWEKTARDWTQTPFAAFCREIPAERVDELVIIYSNSNYHNRTPITAENITPTLAVSNIGCSGWKTDQFTYQETDGVRPLKMTWSAAVRRQEGSFDPGPIPMLPPEGTPVTFVGYFGSGDLTWSFEGAIGGCSYAGNGTIPLDRLALAIWTFTPPGAIAHRVYWGVMASSQMVHYIRSCGNSGTESFDQYLPGWDITFPDELKTVSSDGTRIHDEHSIDLDRSGKVQWTFSENPP